MAEIYKALAAADLPVLGDTPPLINSPLSGMMSRSEAPPETLLYRVPDRSQAIVKMIIVTSGESEQEVTLRCYSELGPMPLFGPIRLCPHEWAEWHGSLTLAEGGEIRGATSEGEVSIGIYGMERTP